MNATLIFLFVLSGVFVVLIIAGVFWSIRSGQFDDLQGPAERILMDDDDQRLPGRRTQPDSPEQTVQPLHRDENDKTADRSAS